MKQRDRLGPTWVSPMQSGHGGYPPILVWMHFCFWPEIHLIFIWGWLSGKSRMPCSAFGFQICYIGSELWDFGRKKTEQKNGWCTIFWSLYWKFDGLCRILTVCILGCKILSSRGWHDLIRLTLEYWEVLILMRYWGI